MYGGPISRQHEAMLREVVRNERAEDAEREARSEAYGWACAAMAPQWREAYEAQVADHLIRSARLARAEQQRRDEVVAAAEDYRDALLATGQGRYRTVAEVLAASGGPQP